MWTGQERILGQPMDVEELSRVGAQKAVCPYYSARSAVPGADIVLLPYGALLSKVVLHSPRLQKALGTTQEASARLFTQSCCSCAT